MEGMPILNRPELPPFPWSILAPMERRVWANHHQTLDVIRQRGGLDPCELLAIVEDRTWQLVPEAEALRRLEEAKQRYTTASELGIKPA